jgi:hypothetical protein
MLYPAEWPEPTADPTGHNNYVIILVHYILVTVMQLAI